MPRQKESGEYWIYVYAYRNGPRLETVKGKSRQEAREAYEALLMNPEFAKKVALAQPAKPKKPVSGLVAYRTRQQVALTDAVVPARIRLLLDVAQEKSLAVDHISVGADNSVTLIIKRAGQGQSPSNHAGVPRKKEDFERLCMAQRKRRIMRQLARAASGDVGCP